MVVWDFLSNSETYPVCFRPTRKRTRPQAATSPQARVCHGMGLCQHTCWYQFFVCIINSEELIFKQHVHQEKFLSAFQVQMDTRHNQKWWYSLWTAHYLILRKERMSSFLALDIATSLEMVSLIGGWTFLVKSMSVPQVRYFN